MSQQSHTLNSGQSLFRLADLNVGLHGDEREVKEKGPAPEPRVTRQHAQVKSKVVANQKGGMSYRDAVGGKKFKDMADRPPVNVAGDVSTGTQGLVVEIPEDTKAFQEWHGKALVDSDSSESGSDDTEEMEEDQAVEVEKTALVMGTHQTHNGGSLPQVDLNWQPRSVSESGSPKEDGRAATVGFCEHVFESARNVKRPIRKPSILRPKKAKCSSFNVSPMEDNMAKKRLRAEREEPFDLNKLLGRGLFGDISRVAELEEGEIRDAEQEMPGKSPPSALDLNSFASPADSDIHSHLGSGEDEIVADSVNFQEINEVKATVKMGEIVDAFLGNHCELVKEIINGEGINGVNQ
ncbi:hypothetical protein L1987_06633 [Smallanthus sonchifolius]|uniref:Uncharacterized protein n=1 Tax=Smallanthus sonchifolius TaxID=185202 RepID=A0ACB9JYS0_9ASTR|nr:hypothetical protein L1987_06633 [Smallanthus sonchifolius]